MLAHGTLRYVTGGPGQTPSMMYGVIPSCLHGVRLKLGSTRDSSPTYIFFPHKADLIQPSFSFG
jgi:hypothetical protein